MTPDFLSAIAQQLSKQLPFVVYRKPKASFISAIFQADPKLNTIRDFSETGFVFAPFDADNPSYFIKTDTILKDPTHYETAPIAYKKVENIDSEDKTSYIKLVQKAITETNKGTFEKVVLSRSIVFKCAVKPLEILQSLIHRYENALCYLWYHPKVGMWMGATPEKLLHAEGNRLTTMSLAGTQKYNGENTPTWGEKERKEQQLVTEYIAAALKEQVNNLEISETETVRAGNLRHLRTKLSGTMNHNLASVIKVLHPTPAVCGMPLAATKKFVMENEGYERKFYTGYLGELNFKKESDLFVNLRCMEFSGGFATIYVGGGITKDSVPQNEWEETVAKSRTMLDVLLN
ncbi:isochorismate synthase [Maribacter algicola]|uniref:Isochorismate synthase n=1 Tax=Meishania litoralis TaxID=3434685 RepID=A0ACC7LLJ8_9FLAO